MSIIQTIRDKAAWMLIGAIALALIAFILQDAFSSGGGGSAPSSLGEINGKEINAFDFEQRYTQAEAQYRQAGYPLNDVLRSNIRESIWNEYLEDAIFSERYEKLGITVTDNELSDILYGENPPQDLRQQFTDPNTGMYDANAAYQQILALSKQKNSPMYASFFNQYLPALRKNRQREKYISLLSNSAYVPKWLVERMAIDNSQAANISYVSIPYATVSDSLITVTDKEITDYVNKNKEDYRQDESRGIEYVMFDAGPSATDSAAVLNAVQELAAELQTDTVPEAFVLRHGSETPYFDGYIQSSKLQIPDADSIRALSVGEIYGPYLDNGNYTLAKMIGKRVVPDSVKVRHILIKTGDQGQMTLSDSVAKARIDSIVMAIRGGARFDSMVARYSDDQGSLATNGEYEFSSVQFGGISREFAEAIFYGNVGDKKTVKVSNASYSGYHYIEVLNQRNFEQGFNVVYLSKPILPSDQTINAAMSKAAEFAAEARNKKAFDDAAQKHGYNKFTAFDIKPLESMVIGLGSSRELVRWVYESKVGTIADRPIEVEDKFVVPVVTHAYEDGVMPPAIARPLVESIIRNKKKAEEIRKKIGSGKSLEEIAQATAQPQGRADSLQFNSPFIPNVGQEGKVVGAAFNKNLLNKVSEPIAGNAGVFVIRVESQFAMPNQNFDVISQQASLLQMQQRALSDPRLLIDILKKDIKIEDNRRTFF